MPRPYQIPDSLCLTQFIWLKGLCHRFYGFRFRDRPDADGSFFKSSESYLLDFAFSQDLKGLSDSGDLTLRRAYASDVNEILVLINGCASSNLMLPRGPKYLYENIRDFVVVEADTEKAEPRIVACGSLYVLWEDIDEIRSLAVHPQFQKRGLGSEIVRYLIEEARKIRIEKVCAFTLDEEFFGKQKSKSSCLTKQEGLLQGVGCWL